jgi:ferric-dicitrate binding protein FerR (iron transport regulator)
MTDDDTLTNERLEALLSAYGADLTRFPDKERARAARTLERSPAARAMFEHERAFDSAFQSVATPELSPELARRLAEVPLRAPQRRFALPGFRWVVPGLGWAVALSIGLFVGMNDAANEGVGSTEGAAELEVEADAEPGDDDDLALMLGSLDELEVTP